MMRSVSTRRLPYNAAHPIPVIGRLSAAEEEQLKVKARPPSGLPAIDLK